MLNFNKKKQNNKLKMISPHVNVLLACLRLHGTWLVALD